MVGNGSFPTVIKALGRQKEKRNFFNIMQYVQIKKMTQLWDNFNNLQHDKEPKPKHNDPMHQKLMLTGWLAELAEAVHS
jgi:hypothetical protein